MAIFNTGFGDMDVRWLKPKYTGRYEPDPIGPTLETAWIYLQFFNYKHGTLECTEANRCWVWIAQGDGYGTRTSTANGKSLLRPRPLITKGEGKRGNGKKGKGKKGSNKGKGKSGEENSKEGKRGVPYVCIGQGHPQTWKRDEVYGRPVEKPEEESFVTRAKQGVWDELWDEFNARFDDEDFNPSKHLTPLVNMLPNKLLSYQSMCIQEQEQEQQNYHAHTASAAFAAGASETLFMASPSPYQTSFTSSEPSSLNSFNATSATSLNAPSPITTASPQEDGAVFTGMAPPKDGSSPDDMLRAYAERKAAAAASSGASSPISPASPVSGGLGGKLKTLKGKMSVPSPLGGGSQLRRGRLGGEGERGERERDGVGVGMGMLSVITSVKAEYHAGRLHHFKGPSWPPRGACD
ncbi:hypothetical protein BDP27DRAFT_1368651 [Rhodocollybia butyracea]|uniref:Uncharacterized protein n=1 Tax=Rhodocollybia butyracea TaxID=206335 RepID=A0A9P5PGB5_9AGAR|nr:hypothetical protein BDP27DRAFT_1368651 [Rhodocollybia butyracea]